MKRTILRTAIASLAALSLGSGLAAAQTPKKGGMLNFGVVAEPPNYDCHGSTTFALVHPVAPHYSLLVKFDGKEFPKIVPDLAESWSVAPDGMTYTFKIRSGVKFHDGSPLTSEDIKASYDRIISPPEGVVSIRKAYYSDLAVEAPDANTVVFKLKNQMAGVLEAWPLPSTASTAPRS
jgi:peptide/nickel transport system substrate-binding protein